MQIPISTRYRILRTPFSSYRRSRITFTALLFLLPAFVFFTILVVYPVGQSFYYSLFNWKGFGPAVDYVGFQNYQRILTDKAFIKAVSNGLILVGLSLVIQLPLALAVALMVGRELPGRRLFRTIFFMPFVFSEVITAIMWMGLFNPDPDRGLFNALLVLVGIKPQGWLGDPNQVLGCIFAVLTWKYFGFHMLLYMAGLQNIPKEIEEAALIDGANGRQMIMFVILPLLWGTIRTSIYLSVLGALQQFGIIWVMTKGGPVNASEVMATYMYRYGFVRFWLGYGSAVAIVMLLISLVFSLAYLRLVKQQDYLS
ncbi:sugar ABC transporter permease [Thermanaerothrix sp. 4228-RoL]|uniref:Sugar ABC transporter permease n=1 Tax=Thermanaerothrix solaris TaxID=3058434 RepID=A0ABU3NQ22_9CHLR|nr:sugar ABC transporter permease [Thermanaerothrix sp. 4228-RoL]MDT8898480.1 sugar ABC transporter permease [Thermanaerothrix sp. 4228-RoL]